MSNKTPTTALVLALLLAAPAYAADPPILPRLTLTPGAVSPSCTIDDICPHEAPGLRGPVSTSMRKAILQSYGATSYCAKAGACELDHSIPVELCGATVKKNLWPQSYRYTEGAHQKDQLENALHRRVCAGTMPLPEAQHIFASDWLRGYTQYVAAPLSDGARQKDQLESALQSHVLAGTMAPSEAKNIIASDWQSGYEKYVAK